MSLHLILLMCCESFFNSDVSNESSYLYLIDNVAVTFLSFILHQTKVETEWKSLLCSPPYAVCFFFFFTALVYRSTCKYVHIFCDRLTYNFWMRISCHSSVGKMHFPKQSPMQKAESLCQSVRLLQLSPGWKENYLVVHSLLFC